MKSKRITAGKSLLRIIRGNTGMTFMEVMITMAIIVVLIAGGVSAVFRVRNIGLVRSGIMRVFELKDAVDIMAKECGGYPDRPAGSDFDSLKIIVNRCGTGSPMCTTYPNGLPEVYPTGRECDAVSLQNTIAANLLGPACDVSDPECAKSIRANNQKNFNSMFVEDGAGTIAPDCSVADGGAATGWNYILVPHRAQPTRKPVAVVCANILYNAGRTTGSITVVLNSAGVTNANIDTANNSGVIGPDGGTLPNGCPCGPWCGDNINNRTGCCQTCTDPKTGIEHTGLGFRYR